MGSALARLQAGFSIGIEAPLDNDWTPLGEHARRAARRLPGEPDLQRHAELARLADRLGFRALWVRDVPVYDPAFGDAAQVFEVFSYLGYLAGITNDILLGTGAVVLPIREPLLTLKSARSVQRLSGDRLLLGVASGDRPVEYPLFGRDFDTRGSRFREQIALLREGAAAHLPQGLDVLPAVGPALPLFVAGLAQQQSAWIGQHMDGCLAYPGTPQDHAQRVAAWRAVAGNKPYASFIYRTWWPMPMPRCSAGALGCAAAAKPCWPSCTPCRRPVSTTSACSSAATNGRWPRPSTRSPSTCCRTSRPMPTPLRRMPRLPPRDGLTVTGALP